MTRRLLPLAALLALLGPLAPPAVSQLSGEYRIGPKDLVQVTVLEVPEVNSERRIGEDGTLELPVLGPVKVAGLTASEAQDRLVALLTSKYVNRANVTVLIREYASKPLWVGGAVSRPGPLTISGRWDLQQAILAAGGIQANARKVTILRRSANGLSDRLEVDADELFVRSSPQWNVPIFPGDIVTVQARQPVKVFCLGEFKSPGAVEFGPDERTTLLALMAKTGGLSDRASRGKIRVKRRGSDGVEKELFFDYSRIVSGKEPDPELQTGDVVIVKESLF